MTPRFPALFWRQILRRSWRQPFLTGLNILGIALGITVFLAIQIANRGAISGFRQAAELTTGRADLEIRSANLPETVFPAVAATPGVRVATPIVEGLVTLPDQPGEYLRILGVDPLTGEDLFGFRLTPTDADRIDMERWLADPSAIAVTEEKFQPGPLRVLAGNSFRELSPTFVLRTENIVAQGESRLAAMDIGWAQELLGLTGQLSSIQILLADPDERDAVIARLREVVPPDASVAPPAARSEEMEIMLGAFQLNLTAMSLVSVIVGMFLIYNSVGAAVVRRRTEIAILRTCGTTRTEVRALFLGEAALEALIGAVIALFAAPLLAQAMAPSISQSVSSLYGMVAIESFGLSSSQVALAFGLALVASLGAAWWPAAEAARCDPALILHPGAAREVFSPLRLSWLYAAVGFLAIAAAFSFFSLHGGSKFLGFIAAAAVIAAFSLLTPWLARFIASCFHSGGIETRIASDHLVRSLHRNTITIAALSAAVAMTISVTVMIHSFRASVERWVGHTLVADLYFAPAINDIAGPQAFLPPETLEWAKTQPVSEISTFREMPVRFRDQPASLAVVDGRARGDLDFLPGSPSDAATRFRSGSAAAVSESFATRFSIAPGDELELPTPAGLVKFPIAGIYSDFARDRGTILMQRSLFQRHWQDDRFHSLALKLDGTALPQDILDDFRARFGREGQFAIFDNAALKNRVLQIFDETFAITSALRAIAILVAVVGILFSLSVLVMEREREIGVLRAIGASRAQVLGIFLREAALLGFISSLSGLLSGALLAMILTWVVNKAFFGWTIALDFPWIILIATPLWIVPAALIAACLPAWRAACIPPAAAVRFE